MLRRASHNEKQVGNWQRKKQEEEEAHEMTSLSLPPPQKTSALALLGGDDSSDDDDDEEEKQTGVGPQQNNSTQSDVIPTASTVAVTPTSTIRAPSYEARCAAAARYGRLTPEQRKQERLFIPRSLQDFDHGGAFPEIHVAQYPRHMGNPHLKKVAPSAKATAGSQKATATDSSVAKQTVVSTSRALINVEIDKDGEVSYDAIVKRGTNRDKLVYSKHEHLKPVTTLNPDDLALPTPEEEQREAAKTQAALLALVGAGEDGIKQSTEEPQFIQYTPRPDAPGYNPAAAQRVIQMVPAKIDPLQPPKHKHLKAPPGPAEDPVPVLHAPPSRKLTKEERDAWNVPTCISNWKNMRGYTIPLDKRLAADGRHAVDNTQINPNFATLAESLYVAERQARQEVRLRAQVQTKLAMQEKEAREEELRRLAQQARLERGGAGVGSARPLGDATSDNETDNDVHYSFERSTKVRHDPDTDEDDEGDKAEDEDEVAARQREQLRRERKREREREMRLKTHVEVKKQRLEEERDVSEKIALGVHTGTGGDQGVDSRLYNQSGGFDSGFGREDDYNAYTKPLFERQAASASIYRPTRGEASADDQYDELLKGATTKFQPDKGFAGAEGGKTHSAGPRNAPVQFEKK